MAYVKITPIKQGTHIGNALDYIQNSDKTDGKILVSSYMCSSQNAFTEFENIHRFAMKKGNNIAHHIIQSFSPEDNISTEEAIEIGKLLMKKMYPNNQYVLATHIDRGHIHNHILVNAVDFVNYKKINSNKQTLNELRNISDKICAEKGLSVIEQEPLTKRKKLMQAIDEAVKNSTTIEDFFGYMQAEKYEIKQGKHLAFKGADDERFIRLSSIGTAYSEASIKKRIEQNIDIPNRKKQVYDNKSIRMSKRKRLRIVIDNAVKKSNSYDDFLDYMKKENYEIKQGKHLAFRLVGGDRFQRSESLGEYYSEYFIRLKIEDFEAYKRIKAEMDAQRIDKVTVKSSGYLSHYEKSKNINANIKTMALLRENNIKSIEELNEKIAQIQKQNIQEKARIASIQREVSAKFDIVNSIRIYWQFKPLAEQARNIKDSEKRAEFITQHQLEMDKFKRAVDIMNKAKDEYGSLPKSEQIYSEIKSLNVQKEKLEADNKSTYDMLKQFENAKYNYEQAVDEQQSRSSFHKKTRN